MKKRVIAVDIDDVLALSAKGFVEFSNKQWGTKLTPEDYSEQWAKMWGVDHAEGEKRAQIIYGQNILGDFEHIAQARDVLSELSKSYQLVITTSRVRVLKTQTLNWINKYYPDIFSDVHFAGFYDELTPESHKQNKAELCLSIGADYLIDDHPKHCIAAAEAGISALLFGDYAWSRNLTDLPASVTRVKTWVQIKKYFANEKKHR